MRKLFLLVAIALGLTSGLYSQGTLRGKITDKNGETLIGAVIMKKSNLSYGTITDLDGNYTLKLPDSTEQTLIISYVTYKKIETTVHPKNGEVLIKDFILQSDSEGIKMNEAVVEAKAVRSNNNYMEKVKQNSSTTIDYISAETMKKTGDVNVVAAVARVSGVSTSGGLITVRGIGDRYVKTAINGSRIPTLDPFTNNIKLDMFPASLVDNVIITKTLSPDLPGDWAGAYMSIETKDYPDQLSVNVETSVGYNSQATFKEILSSQRSSTDWLGYDNGLREHDHASFVHTIASPNQYQEFTALGLGSYFNSLGYTESWANVNQDDNAKKTFYKLGLVQLGLLPKSQFDDPDAFKTADNNYKNGPYRGQAFDVINAGAVKSSLSFPNTFETVKRKAPVNFSQNFSVGNQIILFGRPLGFLAGFRYSSGIVYDPKSTSSRLHSNGDRDSTNQQVSRETNGWSALMNVSYKFTPNHSVTLLFMPNVSGVNNVREATEASATGAYNLGVSRLVAQFYESRKQLVYQFKSEHYFPATKLKAELNASYTHGTSTAPDFKAVSLPVDQTNINSLNVDGQRFFRYLTDNLFDSRLTAELPINTKPDLARKIKFGAAYQRNNKKSDQYNYYLSNGNQADKILLGHESEDPFGPQRFAIVSINDGGPTHSVQKFYNESGLPTDHSFGYSNITAGFAMVDYAINTRTRVSGGLRVEQAYMYTDLKLYDSLGLARNETRRKYTQDLTLNPSGLVNPGKLDELSYLPSVGVIYKIKKDEHSPINLRVNFSQSVARPSIRELSNVSVYDYELRDIVTGNPDLKMVQVNNYDLRLESYFNNGDNVSLSLFYKDFKNQIELIGSQSFGYFWINNENKSWLTGVELEGTKVLTKHFDLKANLTFVNSRATFNKTYEISNGSILSHEAEPVSRVLYGQAPYVLNGILSYTTDSLGLTVAVSYNIQGPKLVIIGVSQIPDVYERPRNLLDLKISKKLSKHFSVSIKINDILNAAIRRSYKTSDGYVLDYDSYRFGTNYIFGLSYKL